MPEGLLFLAFAVIGVGAFLYRISKATRVLKAWSAAAAALHLETVATTGLINPRLRGVADGLQVTVESDARRKKRRTTITVNGATRFPRHLHLRREGLGTALGKLFEGEDIQLGDAEFDATVLLRGDPATAVALMTSETRAAIVRGVNYGISLTDGTLSRETDHEVTSRTELENLLRTQLKLARLLVPTQPVLLQLATNSQKDPLPTVRARNLEALLAADASGPVTTAALRAALADPSPLVRLRAAEALPDEGRPVLAEVARDTAVSDDLATRAITALGKSMPLDLGIALLEPGRAEAFPQRTGLVIDVLASIPDLPQPDRRSLATALTDLLPTAHGQLAVAAARALGATGDAADEPALIAALERGGPGVLVAAADALRRIGTAAAVAPLHTAVAAHPLDVTLRLAANEAIATIKTRLIGATEGQVALADGDAGRLALSDAAPGLLTLNEPAAAPSTPDGDDRTSSGRGPRGRSTESS